MTHVLTFDEAGRRPVEEMREKIGAKATSLGLMASLGLPVPPGFAISTEACRSYLAGAWPDGLEEELRDHLGRIEATIGRAYGDPRDPLLVSVRSGAQASMPGMMDTILNIGLNAETEAGLARATGDSGFAADCRRRLEQMYRATVGTDVPVDPWDQLRGAVEAVFRSWNSPRARSYRQHEGIADDAGTGVTVQAMVFGNRGPNSATGVVFTRNPATGAAELYGDVMFEAQGEDVVAGGHATQAITALEERMPEVAAELRRYAEILERHYADLCDIEFTVEEGRLWMLQVRVGKRSPTAALRMAVDMAEDPAFPLSRSDAVHRVAEILADPPVVRTARDGGVEPLATGLGASPGVASGEIALTADRAAEWAEEGRVVVLVRPETSPDDVHGMARAAGIVTATGGLASHAAVVARGWAIPAVVGAGPIEFDGGRVRIGTRALAEGDEISIDGASGEIFAGALAAAAHTAPEVETLRRWAEELDITLPAGDAEDHPDESAAGPTAEGEHEATADTVLRAYAIKGYGEPDAIAPAICSGTDDTADTIEALLAEGLLERAAGSIRPTSSGRSRADELLTADRETWGAANAEAALDGFVELDGRMKEVVNAWQVRTVDGAEALNDHTDAAYDQGVLDRLLELHRDAAAWLAPHAETLPRLACYGRRLEHAAERASAGEGTYVASPRVDSYHGVWFELHEELIRLAGRTRADEVAAGRA